MIPVDVIHMPLWILQGCSRVLCHILGFKEMLYDQYNSKRTEIRHESHFRISIGSESQVTIGKKYNMTSYITFETQPECN